jgi:DNA-binding response OmpR family regulator
MSSAETQPENGPGIVLLVEDEPLIAMTAEMMLEDLEVKDIRIAHTVADAMAVLDTTAVGLAILDYNLGRENSVAIAERLAADGVRFVFASGAEPVDLPESCAHAKSIMKPYSLKELDRILRP